MHLCMQTVMSSNSALSTVLLCTVEQSLIHSCLQTCSLESTKVVICCDLHCRALIPPPFLSPAIPGAVSSMPNSPWQKANLTSCVRPALTTCRQLSWHHLILCFSSRQDFLHGPQHQANHMGQTWLCGSGPSTTYILWIATGNENVLHSCP